MNFSYWEQDTYFSNIDFAVIGAGIVGLSTAYHLKLKYPKAKIIVLERGVFSTGASTKNAGFACFGTLSEILWYLENQSEEEIYKLVEKRYKGLKKLREILGDESIGYKEYGGYEVFKEEDEELMLKSFEKIDEVNQWLFSIFNQNAFTPSNKDFGMKHIIGMIESPMEGQIHTGNMMKAFTEKVTGQRTVIINGAEVSDYTDGGNKVELEINRNFKIKAGKIFICTNGFARNLADVDVVPARAQVLVTNPIENLKIKGNFHMEKGFYYLRNTGNRILFGGARNLDIEGETTMEFGITNLIQNQLEKYLRENVLPGIDFKIENRWSGIMGMGSSRNPIVEQLSENVYCGVRLTGTGVAIGSVLGDELSDLV